MHNNMISLILFLFFSFNALASISTLTKQTVKGTEPVFNTGEGKTSIVARLSFELDGHNYNEFDGTYTSETIFSKEIKLSDFTIIGLSPTDFAGNYYYDNDGDGNDPINPLLVGTLSYKWIDNNQYEIPTTDYNKSLLDLDADPNISFPLRLEITNTNAQVQSAYGDPILSQGIVITKSYLINYQSGIYAIKPASTSNSCQWVEKTNGAGTTNSDGWVCASQSTDGQSGKRVEMGGGYTSDYIPDIGFKPVPSNKAFPTVGFPGAEFTIIMIGKQSDYKFTSDNPAVSVNSDTGVVKLIAKPSGTVTITANRLSSNIDYPYSFTITKWYTPKSGTHNYSSAITLCGGENNIISRAEFTNSPIANIPTSNNWSYVRNYGTRAIDGTLYGEWGYMSDHSYSSSAWQNNRYWTRDINEDNSPNVNQNFFVASYDGGYIGYQWVDDTGLSVVCK